MIFWKKWKFTKIFIRLNLPCDHSHLRFFHDRDAILDFWSPAAPPAASVIRSQSLRVKRLYLKWTAGRVRPRFKPKVSATQAAPRSSTAPSCAAPLSDGLLEVIRPPDASDSGNVGSDRKARLSRRRSQAMTPARCGDEGSSDSSIPAPVK